MSDDEHNSTRRRLDRSGSFVSGRSVSLSSLFESSTVGDENEVPADPADFKDDVDDLKVPCIPSTEDMRDLAEKAADMMGELPMDTSLDDFQMIVASVKEVWCVADLSTAERAIRNAILFGEHHNSVNDRYFQFNRLLLSMEKLMEHGTYDDDLNTAQMNGIKRDLKLISHAIYYNYRSMLDLRFAGIAHDHKAASVFAREIGAHFASEEDNEAQQNQKDIIQLVEFYLDLCEQLQYRKKDGLLYKPLYTSDRRFYTYCYVEEGKIKPFIYRACNPVNQNRALQAKLLSRAGNISQIESWLENCVDERLPELEVQRGWWAFPNGVYDSNSLGWYPYMRDPNTNLAASDLDCRKTCVHFINQPFEFDRYVLQSTREDGTRDARFVGTPIIDQIPQSQNWPPEVIVWMYVMLGRMLYRVGEHDNWQVFPFLRGTAGTGKSSLLRLISLLFPPSLVGILMNTGRTVFALEHLLNKFIFLCFDLDSKMNLDQTKWNSMVTGEPLSVERMYNKNLDVNWDTPGGFCGNAQPPWMDKGGSASRRFVIWEFLVVITKGDPKLFDKAKGELPAFLFKITNLYREYAYKYSDLELWSQDAVDIFPQYFRDCRNRLAAIANPIYAFLTSSEVVRKQQLHCAFSTFKEKFAQYCQEWQIKASSIRKDDFTQVFKREGVRIIDPIGDDPEIHFGYTEEYLLHVSLREEAPVASSSSSAGVGSSEVSFVD